MTEKKETSRTDSGIYKVSETIQEERSEEKLKSETRRSGYSLETKSPAKDIRRVPSSQEERASLYYSLREENFSLKDKLKAYDQDMKKMATNLMKLQTQVLHTRSRQGLAPVEKGKGKDVDVKTLIDENNELKQRVKETTAVINSMHNSKAVCKARHHSPAGRAQTTYKAKRGYDMKDRNIEGLSAQLREMTRQLIALERGKTTTDYSFEKEVSTKDSKLIELERLYSNLEMHSKGNETTFELYQGELQKYAEELEKCRLEVAKLNAQLIGVRFNAKRLSHLTEEEHELTEEINKLQARVSEFAYSPFMRQSEGQDNILKRLDELESEIKQLERETESLEEKKIKTNYDNEQLKKSLKDIETELSAVKEENEKMKSGFAGEHTSKLLAARDAEEYQNIMEALKYEGSGPKWARVNFLPERETDNPEDPVALVSKIEKLKLERGQIAADLEKAQILRKARGKVEDAKQAIENKINELEKKIEIPTEKRVEDGSGGLARGMIPGRAVDIDALTDFSADTHVSELPEKNNILDILLIDSDFYADVLEEGLNISEAELGQFNTLVEVDFYNHDTQFSQMKPGLNPKYSLQIAFQVVVDDAFLKHMHESSIEVTCFYNHEGAMKAIGKAYIPLKELIDKVISTVPYTAAVVTRSVVFNNITSEETVGTKCIGKIKYKMRMRNDMAQEVKEYKIKKEFKPTLRSGIERAISPSEVRTFKITILKCTKLLVKDPSRSLAPFVYYSFFKFWNTSKTMGGTDPLFDDSKNFDVAMSPEFLEYLHTEPMEVVVFDDKGTVSMRPREAQTAPLNEIIGRSNINLADLVQDNERKFLETLYSIDGKDIAGYIEINIAWFVKKAEGNPVLI